MSSNRPPECQHCNKECTIHLTQIMNGKVKKVDMCEGCPSAKNFQDVGDFGLLEDLVKSSYESSQETVNKECPSCGMTDVLFRKNMRFGCVECFEVFEEEVAQVVSQTQSGDEHVGKKAVHSLERLGVDEKIRRLEDELEQAIEKENYEKAALIRDQIIELDRIS